MAHFNVLVISDDSETMLAPYGIYNEDFFKPIDVTGEYGKFYEERYGDFADLSMREYLAIDEFAFVDTDEEEQFAVAERKNYARLDGDNLVRAVRFENPDGEFDFYTTIVPEIKAKHLKGTKTPCYAVVDERGWHLTKGKSVAEVLDGYDGDTIVSLVNCHS